MDGNHRKESMSPKEQVAHLKEKGVKFNIMSEGDAERFLRDNNNYFRLLSYRANFAKVDAGPRKGQYANLDFGMLVDLSIIDMLLRREMLTLTLDVEHFARMKLLREIEEHGEDGYAIVSDFVDSYDVVDKRGRVRNTTWSEVRRNLSSPYTKGMMKKYPRGEMPVWVFMEVTSFGTFCHFRKFCSERFGIKNDSLPYMLLASKTLRNACAHNNCLLNDLSVSKQTMHHVSVEVAGALAKIKCIGHSSRTKKMRNDRMVEMVTTLYLHHLLVSEGVRNHATTRLGEIVRRMHKHIDYYAGTAQISSAFDYLGKVIGAWYPEGLMENDEDIAPIK